MYTEDGYFVQKCLAGEPEAFGMLVDKYKASIYSLAYSKVRNFHDAQDIAQEAFLRAYQKLGMFRRNQPFKPWLYAITSNLCTDFLRKKSRLPELESVEDVDESTLEAPSVEAYRKASEHELVHEALSELPEIYRQVLSLYYLGGMKSKEIAQFLGTSVTNINARLSRARGLLKEEIISMMSTTFDEVRLQPGFTFRLVEAIKQTKIQTPPSKMTLPISVSAAMGLIALLLTFTIPQSPLYRIGQVVGSALPSKIQVPEEGVIPVDTVEITQVISLSPEMDAGDLGKKPVPEPAPMFGGGKWERRGDMPTPRGNLAAAAANGKIYVMGGYEAPPARMFQAVDEYDPLTGAWTKKQDMFQPRLEFNASVVEGKIYAIGGAIFAGPGMADVDAYDPELNSWSKKAPMPTSRRGLATAVVNGKIYALGGMSRAPWTALSTVEMYDPTSDTWTPKADMPTARVAFSACAVNGKIYAIGGRQVIFGKPIATVEIYDPETDTWTHGTDMPTARASLSCIPMNGRIYAIGGHQSSGNDLVGLPTLEVYNPETDTWTEETEMPIGRFGFRAGAVDGKIYVIGGWPDMVAPAVTTVDEFEPGVEAPQSVNPTDKLPTTWGEVKAAQ